ncbi:MAG: UDP-3-O-(3-hydroxymyristoyl)glucosamine N-acyltransferase [Bdellovibrionaceae bacterium]|nr:UDP-3-O-(3-hydroxymyristoyl)glucosamine N-acyltransferase [Pseudobdellovibrionaceae bacterium]
MYVNKIDDLLKIEQSDLKLVSGTILAPVTSVSTPEKAKDGSLVFVSTNEQWNLILCKKPAVIISNESILPATLPKEICVVSTKNIKRAMTYVLPLFDISSLKFTKGIHPTASVSNSAIIGKNVSIGTHCFIGNNVKIGDDTCIGPNSIIEDNAVIGQRAVLHGQVFLGYNCIIGDECNIHAHATIGSDGFGFFTDKQYNHYKVPQIGNVVIGDRVELGAGCCIDRATIDSTTIQAGSKLDNLCHIAHNCTIGENSLIAAGFFVAGSTHLGKRFTAGGGTVVSTQLCITDDVTLAGRSTVTNDITESGQYGGYPLQPLKDALRTISTLANIVDMRKKLNQVLKTLSIKE